MKTRRLRVAGTLLATSLMMACTVLGPDYQEPETRIQDDWSGVETPTLVSNPPSSPRWWSTAFNDPVLDELIAKGIAQNLDVQSAGLRVLQARQSLNIAIGNQYPQEQEVSGSAEKERSNKRTEEIYNIGFNLSWEADVWGRFTLAVRAAEAQLDASVADYDGVMVTMLADIASNYLKIRTLQRRIEVAKANVKLQEENLDIARTKFEGGLVTELDVDQATTLLYNTRAQVYAFDQQLQQTRNILAVLLGEPPRGLNPALMKPAPLPTVAPEISIGMPQELLRRRPDIRSAERQLAAQSSQIGFAITELYPHFSLGGSIGSTVDTAEGLDFDDMFGSDASNWNVMGGFQWDVLNYGRLKSNIRLQDALFQQLATNYRNSILQAQSEVENSIVAYLSNQRQSHEYRLATDAALRASSVSSEQYQDGLVDFDTVINVLASLRAQQDLQASTEGLVAASLVEVYRALGGGWEIRDGKAPDTLLPEETRDQMLQRTKYWEGHLP
ncbi:MAG: efflux transporter outer membrane subunit [Gammaproteobacteria bacterium]|nr:efflux transporter outer membrane subunit [Gammaproteobacteria bacterium]